MENIHEENELIIKISELNIKNKQLIKGYTEYRNTIRKIFKKLEEEIKEAEKSEDYKIATKLKQIKGEILRYDVKAIEAIAGYKRGIK